MIYCHPVKKDYFTFKINSLKNYYFNLNYIKCSELSNQLIVEISKFKGLNDEKTDIISYKRLADFEIENNILKFKVKIY